MPWTRLAISLLAAVAASSAGAGDVVGTARLSGALPPAHPLPVTKDRGVCGESVEDESLLVDGGRVANVIVSLAGAPPGPPVQATLDQQRCRYVPHVQAVPVGSTLDILNGDPLLHSARGWVDHTTRFDVVMPQKGMRVPTRLDRPGLVQVRCDVHGWMSAYVLVAQGPAAVTGKDGQFVLRGAPAGSYTLTAWHERLGERRVQVTVPATGEVQVAVGFGG